VVGLVALQFAVAVPALASPGDLDPGFGDGGKLVTDFAGNMDEALAVAVQADGKIVAAGHSLNLNGGGDPSDWAVARHNADGTLDPSFGTGGKVAIDLQGTGASDQVRALAMQGDGKIVAGGSSSDDFALTRFLPDGALDPSFGVGGVAITDLSGNLNAIAMQADGKIVAAGEDSRSGSQDFAVARYLPDGTLDAGFGSGGLVITDIGAGAFDSAQAVAVQADGKIVAAGTVSASSSPGFADFALARYLPDGELDSGFGIGGLVTTDVDNGSFNDARAVAVQADGKIVAAGSSSDFTGSGDRFTLARYQPDGTLDRRFGRRGRVTDTFDNSAFATSLVVQADGKLVAAGGANRGTDTGWDFAVLRLTSSGALDRSFGVQGRVTTDFAGGTDSANALAVQADGKLVAAGSPNDETGFGSDFALARYQVS
jgi:uncharacterized delta-60 repeat protein